MTGQRTGPETYLQSPAGPATELRAGNYSERFFVSRNVSDAITSSSLVAITATFTF